MANNNSVNVGNLKNHKNEILKAEIGALLFNLGKTHIGFWYKCTDTSGNKVERFAFDEDDFERKFGYKSFGSYKEYYLSANSNDKSPFEIDIKRTDDSGKLKDFFDNSLTAQLFDDDTQISQMKFLDIAKGNESLKKLGKNTFYRGCENINSGIDKGSPQDKNQLSKLWISNAFGGYKVDVKKDYFDDARLCFFRELHLFLENNFYYHRPNWQTIKEFIVKKIKSWYSHLLSDSRFPINDVTLYEQAYMTATMFKSALAAMFLDNAKVSGYQDAPQSIKWSMLGIQYDKLGLAEKGLKAASIKWYRDTAVEVDDKIKEIIEIDYTLGNEVYKDETGIYYMVPENAIGDKKGDFYELHSDLNELKEKIQKIFTEKFEGEVYPAIFLTKPSRGLMNLGHLIDTAKENFLKVGTPDNLEKLLKHDDNPSGICQVCGMRLANKKNKDDLICNVCDGRNKNRLNDWLDNISDETIWTGELQDKNGRIALITMKFEMKEWLNGDLVNGLLMQNLELNNKSYKNYLDNLINGIRDDKEIGDTFLRDYHVNIPNFKLRTLIEKWFLERSIGSRWENFIKSNLSNPDIIDSHGRGIKWNKFADKDFILIGYLLLQFILRKNPSPARLKRIWDTTREFFKELESNIIEIYGIKDERRQRLVWYKAKTDTDKDIPESEYCDGDIVFWAKDKTVYSITSIEKLSNKDKFVLKSSSNNETIHLSKSKGLELSYKPYFSILDPTPISWQFIIPAENVPEFIKNIQNEYYKNFRWVYGKLPLHIGIVVQNYKKPLYVGIKALRNIRRDIKDFDEIKTLYSAKDLKARQKEAFHCSAQPEKVADCENYYSLYEKTEGAGRYEFYLYTKDKRKQWLDTTQNTADTDKFTIYPNTFDFEFLDTNARRNDIYYRKDEAKRFLKIKQNRPYNLSDWQYFEKFKEYLSDKKSSSKLQNLVNLIYSKLEDWKDNDDSIKTFIISAFVNILELKDKERKDTFAGILKENLWDDLSNLQSDKFKRRLYMFLDMFEFWHTTLKEV